MIKRRIARLIVTFLFLGFLEVGIAQNSASAAVLTAPTISSVTPGNASLTVNMVTAGNSGNFWTYQVIRRDTVNCVNPLGDGVNTNTGSLVSSFTIAGLTNACSYLIRVASNLSGVGNFAEVEASPSNFGNFFNLVWTNDAGTGVTGINRTPVSSGCKSETTTTLNFSYGTGVSPGGTCNTTYYTGYVSGFVKAPFTGAVTFTLANNDDAAILAIQGNTIAMQNGGGSVSANVNMVLNQVYRLEFWFHNDGGPGASSVTWSFNSGSATSIPTANIGNDPSVLTADGGCPLGMASRCAAGSALEIKQATGTDFDGQYWINMGGTPTLVYSIMNSAQGGGGWMLAMRAKNSASTFTYNSSYWVNSTLLNNSYPERYVSGDSYRNSDAKYAPFSNGNNNQLMVLFPDYTSYGNGRYSSTNANPGTSLAYGYSWAETYTTTGSSIQAWTSYNSTTGWGGTSWNVAQTGPTEKSSDPTATPSCIANPATLTSLFLNANRCAFRKVANTWNQNESPYPAIGNGLFYTQTQIAFFGINYASASTGSQRYKTRIGFGWNENNAGDEGSNDGTAGIGLDNANNTAMAAGTHNQCCATQAGVGTSTQMAFELYVRNTQSAPLSGPSTVRISAGRIGSSTVGQAFSQTVTTGSATYRISPLRPGFSVDASTGVMRVSAGLPVGTYFETVTATDGNLASSAIPVTINVVADSSETDTALTFNGSSNRLISSATYTNAGDFTMEAWVKPATNCSAVEDRVIISYGNSYLLCRGSQYVTTFANASGGGWTYLSLGVPVRPGDWVHLAVTRSGNTVSAFVNDDVAQMTLDGTTFVSSYTLAFLAASGQTMFIGGTSASTSYFNGSIDEVKVFSSARTLSQIWTGAHTQESLNNPNLVAYYDFNEGSGATAFNRAQSATSASDLSVSGPTWERVATTSTSGPYTYVTFTRTLINSASGWRVPSNVNVASVLVVGGGGGGGARYASANDGAGGGGGGGVFEVGRYLVAPNSIEYIKVGTGGRGGVNGSNADTQMFGWRGDSSTVGSIVAGGGGGAGYSTVSSQQNGSGGNAGGGGGGTNSYWYAYNTGSSSSSIGAPGGTGTDFSMGGITYPGRTGGRGAVYEITYSPGSGAGGGAGGAATPNVNGSSVTPLPGVGITSSYSGTPREYGRGGTSVAVSSVTFTETPAAPGNGGDGWRSGSSTTYGVSGANGIVIIRYITAQVPTYTKPVNANLNVGMVETFTTNVAQDSATVQLTRTFRWESSTTGANGPFSLIKQGTGAANASFSWTPTDTSTSGSNFVYRLIVTDSDTAGLFITDSSTAFATINPALRLTSKSIISKTSGISKTETFTVSLGTPTYSYALTPDGPFFSLDTSTVGSPRIRIADTATVGTYYETFTVTDSVSASITVPLTIVISTPPSFSAASNQVDSSTVLFLDAGNSNSYSGSGNAWGDLSGRGISTVLSGNLTGFSNKAASGNTCLSAPSYSRSVNGSFNFTSTSSQCAIVSGIGSQSRFTIETWISPNSTQDEYASIFSTPWLGTSTRINYACYFTGYSSNRLVYCNIYQSSADGTAGWGASAISAIVQPNTWSHFVFSYNGSNMNLYVNGVAATPVAYGGVAGLNTYDNIFIGRRWDDVNYYSGGMATFRVYSRALSLSEVQQNFNATKDRFTGVLNENSINQKYGSRFADTYTITSGSESITATFTTNALSGISWDTSTARSLKLLLQDTLTPGTYYDTITAVDIYGSTSRLPLIFTIAKADTVTVFIETPTALSYTGNRAVLTPTLRVNGLIATESGTAQSVTFRYKPSGGTCATGGYCRVGDIGPGGGIVFIDTSTASSDGRIYEVAPYNWSGSDDLATVATYCSNSNSNIGATQIGIGWGETNTNLAKSSCLGGAVALVNNFNQSNSTGYSDWFIPSTNEAIELVKIPTNAGLVRVGSAWITGLYGYWTSTEVSASTQRSIGGSGSSWNVSSAVLKGDAANNMVRPVRAFRPCWAIDTCTSLLTTDTPTFAGDYSIVPTSLIIGSGSLNNYAAVVYQSTPLSISKVTPRALIVPWINTNYPDTFTISIPVTTGVGALRYSTINGTATGCTLDYRKIYTSTQGTCFVTITRQADRNFLADTTTATIFFFTFVLNQPTDQVGSGPGIALNGATALSVDTTTPPSITGLSTLTLSLGAGGTFTVTGTGFSAGSLSVKFWRNKVVVPTASTATSITFNVSDIASSGATTGRISVNTIAGQAISVDTLTITP